jgi:GYF domain 2
MQIFLTIVLCLIIGGATAYFANQRGRDPLIWFMLGLLLGLFGLLLLFLLPPGSEQTTEGEKAETRAPPGESHEYLIKEWYYYDREKNQKGPIRFEKLKELWMNAEIGEDSYVWSEGMPGWKKIEEVSLLYSHLGAES